MASFAAMFSKAVHREHNKSYFYHITVAQINPLPNDNVLDWTKFKAFVDDKLNVATIIISTSDRVTSIFSFSHNVFKSILSQGR